MDLFDKAPIPKAYFTLALPVVVSTVVSMIYNLTDTFFVSQTQNPNLVAGVTLCTPIFSLMIALGDMFGLGGSATISRLFGEGKNKLGGRVNAFSFYMAILTGLLTMVILLVFERPILSLFGANAATYRYAADFYHIMALGSVVMIVSLVPNNTLRTEGLARQSMVGPASGTLVTIVLDPLFIFGFHMGAAGAALATVCGYLLSDVILIFYTVRRTKYLSVSWRDWRIPAAEVRAVFAIGIPASVTNLMTMFGTALMNNYLIRYGADQVAAFGIATKVETIVTMVLVGFAFGAQPLIGYNFGAKNTKRLNAIVRFDLLINVGFAFVLALLLIAIAPQLAAIFMRDQTVVHAAAYMLRVFLVTTPFIGIVLVFTTMFQSMNKALQALVMSLSRQGIIFAIVLVVAAQVFGYHGVVWSQPIADVVTAGLGTLLYARLRQPDA